MGLDGIERSPTAIAGAGAHQLARSHISDDVQNQLTLDTGRPTDRLADGRHICEFQRMKRSHRYYTTQKNGARGQGGGQGAGSVLRHATSRCAAAAAARHPAAAAAARQPSSGQVSTQAQVSTRAQVAGRSERFTCRVTSRVLNTIASPTKDGHRKRVMHDLGADGPNVTKTIVNSFVMRADDESPARGSSQDAAAQAIRFVKANMTTDD